MVATRTGPRRTLRRVKHLQITNDLRGGRSLEFGRQYHSSPSDVRRNVVPSSRTPRQSPQSPRGSLRSRRSVRSISSFDSLLSQDITPPTPGRLVSRSTPTIGGASTTPSDGAARRQFTGILEPLFTPAQRSSVQKMVSYLEDGTQVTTFVMTSPTSHGSADSDGFRSPFQRDPSPPLTPSDADSIWRENRRHSIEIRNQISRLLSFDSTLSEGDETTHRQIFSVRSRSNSLESRAETSSILSIIYASSNNGNNEEGSVSSHQYVEDTAGTSPVEKSCRTASTPPSNSTEKPSIEIRSRRNSSVSVIAMLAPSSKKNLASAGKTMTARFFISGSKACKKLVSRIGICDIFARRATGPYTSAGSTASSEASTLCTSVNNLTARSDGRNYLLNSGSHLESIWSVERDETVGAWSPREGSPAGESEKNADGDIGGYGCLSTSEEYSRGTSTTHETTMSSMSSGLKNSGCDRYLRLCHTSSSEEYQRPPTAAYYEDPSDPTSYYRPEHTQSDIDNDVPTPPSGRCVRPACYTTIEPNTSLSRAWTVLRPNWKREFNTASNEREVDDQMKGRCQDISYLSNDSSISIGSTATVIKKVPLENHDKQLGSQAADQMATSRSQLEGLCFADATDEDEAINKSDRSSIRAIPSTPTTLEQTHDLLHVLAQATSQLPTVPDTMHQIIADTRSSNVSNETVFQPGQPGAVALSDAAKAVPTQDSLDTEGSKSQSWLKQISLRVKASVMDLRKRDLGNNTDRRSR